MKGFRTLAFNAIASAVPILEAAEVADIMPAEYMPYYVLGVAIGNAILRAMTSTAVGQAK